MIVCRNIVKSYRNGTVETVALRGVSFSIDTGEFVAIIGPSGSGKSTLMHILGALDVPTSGEYVLDGSSVSSLNESALSDIRREKIGFVFQAFNLLPRTTVLRNVMLPLLYSDIPSDERERRARTALLSAGMEERLFTNLSNQLSGGQMQRVAIARSLINDPKLILADEPTGNLDTKTSHVVMDTFRRLNAEGRTVVLITHEPEIAEFANRVISVRDGMIESDSKSSK